MLRMLRFLSRKERLIFGVGVLASIVFGNIICVWDFFFARTVGDLTSPDHDKIRSAAFFIAILFQCLGFVCSVSDTFRTWCFRYLCEHQMATIKSQYFRAILRQEPAWHDTQSSSAHISRFSSQLPKMKNAYNLSFSLMIVFLAKGTGSFIFALSADVRLALAVFSILPLIAVLFFVFGKLSAQTSVRQARAYERGAAVASEDIGLLRTIWTFCTQAYEQSRSVNIMCVDMLTCCRYKHEVQCAYKEEARFYFLSSFATAVPYLPLFIMVAFSFGYGAQLVRNGEITGGTTVLRVFFGIAHCAEGFGQAIPYLNAYYEARTVAAEIFDVIDRPSSIDPLSPNGMMLLAFVQGVTLDR
jgi:ATP-binding cassette subfamily B (MDR/TAP) protein 1